MASFERFVAWRYLFSRERRALVSVITLISMAGVSVGVAALIAVLGVMDGADELLLGKITELYPHVRVENMLGPEEPLDLAVLQALRDHPDVAKAEPVHQKVSLVQSRSGGDVLSEGIQLIGVDELGPGNIYNIPMPEGMDKITVGPGEILLGAPLAMRLRAMPGDGVVLYANNPVMTINGQRVKLKRMRVLGFFNTHYYEFDAATAFVSVETMRNLYRIDQGVDYIHVKLRDPWLADRFKQQMLGELPSHFRLRTWGEDNAAFFGALKLEKFALFLILMLIIVVAAFNIIGTLIMMVSEKTREIGILKAMGASQGLIARIFLYNGILIGIVGTAIGVALGLGICAAIPLIKFEMPPSVYNFEHLPVLVRPLTVTIIVLASMAICSLAAVFPAWQASRLNPVEALRHD